MTTAALPPDVGRAIEELEGAFPGRVRVTSDEAGGVVELTDVELGPGWSARSGSLWFLVPFHYPDAAIYPYYVTGATHPAGGALQGVSWRGAPAIQVSLRHNGWDPARDTALGSVHLTRSWLASS
jgi:hypothetical protein